MFPSCYQICEPIIYAPTRQALSHLVSHLGPLEKQVYLEMRNISLCIFIYLYFYHFPRPNPTHKKCIFECKIGQQWPSKYGTRAVRWRNYNKLLQSYCLLKLNISWTLFVHFGWSRDKTDGGLIPCQGRCEAELLDNLYVFKMQALSQYFGSFQDKFVGLARIINITEGSFKQYCQLKLFMK